MSSSDFAVVHTAASQMEAQILMGLLVSEGVPARVPGSELNDEFGQAMKMGPADVIVPLQHIETARDIVAAWKERGARQTD